jgi:hypothetical protein
MEIGRSDARGRPGVYDFEGRDGVVEQNKELLLALFNIDLEF